MPKAKRNDPRAEDLKWGEKKIHKAFLLTETASNLLDNAGEILGTTRSEAMERIIREYSPASAEKERLTLSFSLSGLASITLNSTITITYLPETESPDPVFARIQPDGNPASLLWCGYGESQPEAISKALLAYMGEGESHNLIESYRLGQIDDESVAAWLQVSVETAKTLLLDI